MLSSPSSYKAGSEPHAKFPLNKRGKRQRRGGCLAPPEGQGKMVGAIELNALSSRLSPVCKTTPRRRSDHCRCAAAPFAKGEFAGTASFKTLQRPDNRLATEVVE